MDSITAAEQGLLDGLMEDGGFSAVNLPDAERIVRPAFFRELLARTPASGGRAVRATGLMFAERLNLSGLGDPGSPLPHLALRYCQFPNGITLEDSFLMSVNLEGSEIRGGNFRNVRIVFDLRLNGINHVGELPMHNARIGANLSMNAARIDGRPRLPPEPGGDLDGELAPIERDFSSIAADGAEIGGDVYMRPAGRPFLGIGDVRFPGVRIAGDVSMNGARLFAASRDEPDGSRRILGRAASFDRAEIGGALFCTPSQGCYLDTYGMFSLSGVRARGAIAFSGADLGSTSGVSIDLSDCEAQTVLFDGNWGLYPDPDHKGEGPAPMVEQHQPFRARGEVRLIGAVVRGQACLSGAELDYPEDSFCADNATINGGLFIRPELVPTAEGVERRPCRFRGRCSLNGASLLRLEIRELLLAPPDGPGFPTMLDLTGSTIRADLMLALDPASRGRISLENAHLGNLPSISPQSWGQPPLAPAGAPTSGVLLDLDELTYDRADVVRSGQPMPRPWWRSFRGVSGDAEILLGWLERQYPGGDPTRDSFRPQPFEQAARLLRSKGDRYGAGRIASARHQLQRRSSADRGLGWLGNWLFWLFFDYGYSPARALAWGLLFVVLGMLGTWHLDRNAGLVAERPWAAYSVATTPPTGYAATPGPTAAKRCDVPTLGYALDSFLPLIDLGFEKRCEISGELGYSHARLAEALRLFYAFIGLIFVPVAALTFAGVLRND